MNKGPIGNTAHQIQFLAINKIEQSFHNLYTSLLSVTNPFRNLSEILIFAIFADHTYIKSLHDLCPRKGKLSKKWPLKFKIKSLSLQIHTWWVNCISWCNIMTVTQNLEAWILWEGGGGKALFKLGTITQFEILSSDLENFSWI